jgi:hypothetical protein
MRALCLVLAFTAGCDLFTTYECLSDPEEHAIDPATAACTVLSNSDGCTACFDHCIVGTAKDLNYPACNGDCPTGTEAECLQRPSCRAAYTGTTFFACLPTAPSAVRHDGRCDGLDAYQCSLHDNCSAQYTLQSSKERKFARCVDKVLKPVSERPDGPEPNEDDLGPRASTDR